MSADILTTRVIGSYLFTNLNQAHITRWTLSNRTPLLIGSSGPLTWYGYNLYNPNTYDVFLKAYNGVPIVGSSNVILTIPIPAGSPVVLMGTDPIYHFDTSMYTAVTKFIDDTDDTAVSVGVMVQMFSKQ